MNKDNAKGYLPVVQALAEGKIIQSQYNGEWVDNPNGVSFYFEPECYRIKPEPIKKWYRVALMSYGLNLADEENVEINLEISRNFIKWLTPRIEYIVEE